MIEVGTGKKIIWGVPDVIPTREQLREAVVEGVLWKYGIHLIAGPSGSGKSRLAAQMLYNIMRGEPFFGHKTAPSKFVYYMGERGYGDALATLDDLALPDPRNREMWALFSPNANRRNSAHFRSIENLQHTRALPWIIEHIVLPQFPDRKFLFIDGLSGVLSDHESKYSHVKEMLQELRAVIEEHGITVLATVHTTKTKKDEGYELTRENILGTVAWGGYSDTILLFKYHNRSKADEDPRRIVVISNRRAPSEKLHLTFHEKDDPRRDGNLHQMSAPELGGQAGEDARAKVLRGFLDQNQFFKTHDVVDHFLRFGYSERTAKEALSEAVKKIKSVEQIKHGEYRVKEIDDAFDLIRPEDALPQPHWAQKGGEV